MQASLANELFQIHIVLLIFMHLIMSPDSLIILFIGASDSSLSATNEVSAIWQSSLQHWKYVGKGAFSVVFSAYHNGTKLAVKILQPTKCGSVHEDNFYKEVKLMR